MHWLEFCGWSIIMYLKVVMDGRVCPGIGSKLHTTAVLNDSSAGDMEVEDAVHCHMYS